MRRNGLDSIKRSYRNDILLILFFLIIGLVTLVWIHAHAKSGAQIRVSIDNKEYGTYSLDKNQTITINQNHWENVLVIKNNTAVMTKADCPDKICVNHAAISKKGETIVCLPHKVVVEVINQGNTKKKDQIDIISK